MGGGDEENGRAQVGGGWGEGKWKAPMTVILKTGSRGGGWGEVVHDSNCSKNHPPK